MATTVAGWEFSRHIELLVFRAFYFQRSSDLDRIFAWYTSTALYLDIVSQIINKNYNYNKIPQICVVVRVCSWLSSFTTMYISAGYVCFYSTISLCIFLQLQNGTDWESIQFLCCISLVDSIQGYGTEWEGIQLLCVVFHELTPYKGMVLSGRVYSYCVCCISLVDSIQGYGTEWAGVQDCGERTHCIPGWPVC